MHASRRDVRPKGRSAGPGRPAAGPPVRLTTTHLLVAVVLVAAALRVAHIADSADSPFFTRPMVDGQAYDAAAIALVEGNPRTTPFYQDPLYPYLLALVYRLFGHRFLPVYVIQALLGIGLVLLAYDTGRLLFDRRAGLLAALLVGCYRPFIFYEGVVEKTTLSVFLTGLLLWAVVRGTRSARPSWPIVGGLSLGLASLTRANLLVFAPLLVAVFWRRPVRLRPLLALAGLVLIITPLSIRNSLLAREFVLTTTQAGQNFYIGNSEHNLTGQYEAPPWVRPNPQFEEKDFAAQAEQAAGRKLGYGAVSRHYFRVAFDWMRSHPAGFVKLLLRKTLLYFNNLEVPDSYDLGFLSRYSAVLRLPLAGFGILFALGLAGMVLFFRRTTAHLSLAIFFVLASASVIAFFVLDRYRLPAVVALAPFAGAVVFWSWDRLRGRRYREVFAAAALFTAGLGLSLYPIRVPGHSSEAQSLVNLASVYLTEADTARALASYEAALRIAPNHAEALRSLAIVQMRHDNLGQALALLARSSQADPDNPLTRYYLGMAHEQQGDVEAALAEYRKSVVLKPGEPKFRFGLATALQKLGRYDSALAQYDTLLRLAPDNPLVHHNRAVALYNLGRLDEAAAELDIVRRMGGPVSPDFEKLLARRRQRP